MRPFNEIVNVYFPKVDLYTLPLTRAHGNNHPEVFRVRELFELMHSKVKNTRLKPADLVEEFKEMRVVTNNYTTPSDACKTYKAVYTMLKESDESYHIE